MAAILAIFSRVIWLMVQIFPEAAERFLRHRLLLVAPVDSIPGLESQVAYGPQTTTVFKNRTTFDLEEEGEQEVVFGELRVRRVPQGHFVMNSRFNAVLYEGKALIPPRAERGPWKIFLGSKSTVVAGVVAQRSFEILVRTPRKNRDFERGLFVGTRAPYNWYHWIANTLPSIHIANRAESTTELPLFLPSEISQSPSMLDSLEIFRRERPIVWVERGVQYSVRELFWADSPVIDSPFSQNPRERLPLIHHPSAMADFRAAIVSAVSREELPDLGHKRVFLSRRNNSARPYNQEEVENYLQQHGFVTMFLEDVPFAQQVRLFQSAKFIIGPTGAALANIIFCSPGTAVMRLVGSAKPYENYFANLASIGGARITDLHGENTKPEQSDHYYNIELSRLGYAIRHVEQAENV